MPSLSLGIGIGVTFGGGGTPGGTLPLAGWTYRREITIDNTGNASALTDYQVSIALTSANMDFTHAESDGSDLRITDADGETIIPYFIEAYDSGAETATIWVKVPSIPASSEKTIYLYYGNASAQPFDVPPIGMFTKTGAELWSSPAGPIENMVFDPATSKYWALSTNFTSNGIGLFSAADPLGTWTVENAQIIDTGDTEGSPCLYRHTDGTWYMYYGKKVAGLAVIYYATASAPDGTWTTHETTPLISADNASWRALEPFVDLASNGTFYMTYMQDSSGNVGSGEKCYLATATNPAGPWTKQGLIIDFGPSGSYDATLTADPFWVEFGGLFYVFYAASGAADGSHPWRSAYVTTPDWATFKRGNLVLGPGNEGGFDDYNNWRGGIVRRGDIWYFPYGASSGIAGSTYRAGMAWMSAKSTAQGYPADQVLELFDDFAGSALKSHFRHSDTSGTVSVSGGTCTITVGGNLVAQVVSAQEWAHGYIMETSVRHVNADGSGNRATEVGFSNIARTAFARLYDFNTGFWKKETLSGGTSNLTDMAQAIDAASFHTHSVWRESASSVRFKNDNNAFEQVAVTGSITGFTLPAWFLSFQGPVGGTTSLIINWVRVRKYSSPDPATSVGSEATA
jgi:hypothetical protein